MVHAYSGVLVLTGIANNRNINRKEIRTYATTHAVMKITK